MRWWKGSWWGGRRKWLARPAQVFAVNMKAQEEMGEPPTLLQTRSIPQSAVAVESLFAVTIPIPIEALTNALSSPGAIPR